MTARLSALAPWLAFAVALAVLAALYAEFAMVEAAFAVVDTVVNWFRLTASVPCDAGATLVICRSAPDEPTDSSPAEMAAAPLTGSV